MANVWRAYDNWGVDLPGFIAAGDAACAFNPVYGQGMTTSVVSAGILRDVLRRQGSRANFESEFFRAQGKFLQSVWNMAVRADFRWPQTEGERPSTPALVEAYIKLVVESGHYDSAIRRQIFPAFDLTGSPAMLFTPSCIARVLISTARRRLARRWLGAAPIPELPPLPA
jgi:2-polyprenyl-6-methoxyphenol hydroxylase-like FAD-dependent oxidoreductase